VGSLKQMGDFRVKRQRQESVSPLAPVRCRISLLPPFDTFGGSERILTTNPSPFLLLFFSFFLVRCRYLPCKALVIPMLPYLTELRLAWLHHFFFLCGIFAVRLPGMPSVVSALWRDMVSCTSSWASAMSVLHCLSIGVFLIELLPRF
jgi:hypothetical protein